MFSVYRFLFINTNKIFDVFRIYVSLQLRIKKTEKLDIIKMRRNAYILAVALTVLLAACVNEPTFRVEGSVAGAADKTLYFEHTGLNDIETIDSIKLKGDGSFKFSQPRPESPEFYRLRIDSKVINFSVDSIETVSVTAGFDDFATNYEIAQSENNAKIKELSSLQRQLQDRVNALGISGLPTGIAQDSLRSLISQYKDTVKRNYIYVGPNKAYAYFALFQTLNGYMIFDPLNNKDDVKCFAAVATSLNNMYPHADRSRNLYNMVIKGMKNTRTPKVKQIEVSEDIVSETALIDIPLIDIKGTTRHLTDLKGKVVLLEFTIYQNEYAPARNLALRELYTKYASQGFEIYQISLDADVHYWKTVTDNLPWICVRDPQGPYSTYLNLYGVTELPTAFILNRDNEISLRLDENSSLEEEIRKRL